jgi:hypothetical protein
MEVYLDAGSHMGLDDKPCYYGGVLNFYKLAHTLRTDLGGDNDLKKAEDRFLASRQKLLANQGGVVSIYYHPCEFVHKEFWDSANFRNGANPPREQWKLPAAKTLEQSRIAYETFESYIRFIKRFPEVRFIVASEGAKLYRDKARGRKFSPSELRAIASAVDEPVRFQKQDDYTLAASEAFCLLNDYVAERSAGRNAEWIQLKMTPFGPAHPADMMVEPLLTSASQFERTAVEVADIIRKQERIPSAIWLGSKSVPPEAYFRALAQVAIDLIDGKPVPEILEIKSARLDSSGVAEDNPKLWSWIIFPRGFRAPVMMELAKRQAWTLKPALLDRSEK